MTACIVHLNGQGIREGCTDDDRRLLISAYFRDRSDDEVDVNHKRAITEAYANVLANNTPDSDCKSSGPYLPAKNQVASRDSSRVRGGVSTGAGGAGLGTGVGAYGDKDAGDGRPGHRGENPDL